MNGLPIKNGGKYMERNFHNSQGYKLESQLREAFGKVVYTQTCHNKMAERFTMRDNNIKIAQIVLSAMTTGSFITTIICDDTVVKIVGAIISFLLLIFNSYTKSFNLIEKAESHKNTANLLWKIREEYVSVLTDFEMLDVDKIISIRDDLQNRTYEIYNNSPRTDKKSYLQAQKSLKTEEEQTFSEKEIDVILPNSIRRENRKYK